MKRISIPLLEKVSGDGVIWCEQTLTGVAITVKSEEAEGLKFGEG